MLTHRRSSLQLVALLCVSVLFVRGGGMHLHLCLDGTESASEIHWADAGVHNDAEHASQPHDDRDVEFGELVGKTSKSLGDLQVAILAAMLLLTIVPPVHSRPAPYAHSPIPGSRFFRPPLRGPPL